MEIVDAQRFGTYQYSTFADVDDFRVERYLPTNAHDITLNKYAMGHRARYSISESNLTAYLDDLWDKHGEYSASSREKLHDGVPVSGESFAHYFDELGWPSFDNAMELHSPIQGDGGGATYYFDPATDIAYHIAGYW